MSRSTRGGRRTTVGDTVFGVVGHLSQLHPKAVCGHVGIHVSIYTCRRVSVLTVASHTVASGFKRLSDFSVQWVRCEHGFLHQSEAKICGA